MIDVVVAKNYWVVIPAAGTGSRMQGNIPKQYLTLGGYTVIEHTLARMSAHRVISGIVLSIAKNDSRWTASYINTLSSRLGVNIKTVIGGVERHASVLNALHALFSDQLFSGVDVHDWVLVHDAARPCVTLEDITRLIDALVDNPVGGLLGIPVADTMKKVNDRGEVVATVNRDGLWRALTPQMFRLGLLRAALMDAETQHRHVTDDASAMELAGFHPQMILGNEQNIKVTRPQDMEQALGYLQQQMKTQGENEG